MEYPLSFGLFADAHYADRLYADRHCRDSLEKLRSCIHAFNERRLPLAFNLGDSVDESGSKNADLRHLAELADTYAEFRGDRHIVIGNHDVATLTKREFLENCGVTGAKPFYSFDREGVHVVTLDSNCHADGTDFCAGDFDWAQAWVSREQLEWLQQDLADAGQRPTIVLCHGSLDCHEWESRLDPHCVRNQREVQAVLDQAGNVAAVFMGHYHPGRHDIQNGIPYVTAAALVVGPGPGQTAYAVVSITEDREVLVEGFGRQESFRCRKT